MDVSRVAYFSSTVLLTHPIELAVQGLDAFRDYWDEDVEVAERQDSALTLAFGGFVRVKIEHVGHPCGLEPETTVLSIDEEEADYILSRHLAYIRVKALWAGLEKDLTPSARLALGEAMVAVTSALASLPETMGVLANGRLFDPAYYAELANLLEDGRFPLANFIDLSVHKHESVYDLYTRGLHSLALPDIEWLGTPFPNDAFEMMVEVATHLIAWGSLPPTLKLEDTGDVRVTVEPGRYHPEKVYRLMPIKP